MLRENVRNYLRLFFNVSDKLPKHFGKHKLQRDGKKIKTIFVI